MSPGEKLSQWSVQLQNSFNAAQKWGSGEDKMRGQEVLKIKKESAIMASGQFN